MNERFCCDARCQDNQGRGTCPRFKSDELSWKLSDLAVVTIFVGFLAAFFSGCFG